MNEEERRSKEKFLTIPNIMTLFRIFSIPSIVLLLIYPSKISNIISFIIFTLAAWTDILDGYIARKYHMVSSTGKFLDLMADKLLISSALIMLTGLGRVPAWMVVIIVGREIAVMSLRALASTGGLFIEPSRLGKDKATLQSVATSLLLLNDKYFSIDFYIVGFGLMIVAVIVTILSAVEYFIRYWLKSA
ncbi:MAG: CDP-diacylglycerol--glycerol-3-phosphate 3-phosphatidyltransferase [Candidatus Aenigmatarchaeota archaeon]